MKISDIFEEINLEYPDDPHDVHNDDRWAPETKVMNVKADVLSEKHFEIFKTITPEKEKQTIEFQIWQQKKRLFFNQGLKSKKICTQTTRGWENYFQKDRKKLNNANFGKPLKTHAGTHLERNTFYKP